MIPMSCPLHIPLGWSPAPSVNAWVSWFCLQEREAAWGRVLELAPDSAAAWSNRGTLRLQGGRWADAEADLTRAVELERGSPEGDGSGATLNNLGMCVMQEEASPGIASCTTV
jgi:tetratricopeptide (TPR) repeat protein